MKKALLSCAFMFIFSISMLLGTTYAWWSEEIVVDENIIQMGELDLKVELADREEWVAGPIWYDFEEYTTTGIFETTKTIEPGHYDERHVKFTNEGTIPLAYRIHVSVDESYELRNYIFFGATYVGPGEWFQARALTLSPMTDIYRERLVDLTSPYVRLEPGESHVYVVGYKVWEGLGNEGENLILPFTVTFEAQQIAKAQQEGTIYTVDNLG